MKCMWQNYVALRSLNFLLLEVVMGVYVTGRTYEHEPDVMATMIARRERLSENTCYLMFLTMDWIMDDSVNPRMRNAVTRLKNISYVRHIFILLLRGRHILGSRNQFFNCPHMIRKTCLHTRRDTERLMYAAKIEKGHVEMNGGFQMVQRFTESQAQAREAAQMCPHRQIGSFDVACGYVARIRVSADGCRNGRSDLRRRVPVWPRAVGVTVDLHELREVNVRTKVFFDCGDVAAQTVRCDLESATHTLAQIANERVGAGRIALRRQVRENKLGFRINCHPHVGVSPLTRRINGAAMLFGMNERPEFVRLDVAGMDAAHPRIEKLAALFANSKKQRKNRALVRSGNTRYGTHAHSLDQKRYDLRGPVSADVVPSKGALTGSAERRLTRLAAKPLNPQLSVCPKFLSYSVLASQAGHRAFPLVFLREKPDNQSLGFECGLRPRLNLFPPPSAATLGGGLALTYNRLRYGGRITGLAPFGWDAARCCRTSGGFALQANSSAPSGRQSASRNLAATLFFCAESRESGNPTICSNAFHVFALHFARLHPFEYRMNTCERIRRVPTEIKTGREKLLPHINRSEPLIRGSFKRVANCVGESDSFTSKLFNLSHDYSAAFVWKHICRCPDELVHLGEFKVQFFALLNHVLDFVERFGENGVVVYIAHRQEYKT